MGCGASSSGNDGSGPDSRANNAAATIGRARTATWAIDPELQRLLDEEHILEEGWDEQLRKTESRKHLQEELEEIASHVDSSRTSPAGPAGDDHDADREDGQVDASGSHTGKRHHPHGKKKKHRKKKTHEA
jgi:hypothetical protein